MFSHLSGPESALGDSSMNAPGSGGNPAVYYITPGDINSSKHVTVSRVNFLIQDNNCNIGKFGGIAALVSGIRITCHDENGMEMCDFTGGEFIKVNEDFNLLAGIDVAGIANNAPVDAVPIRWTIEKGLNGKPYHLLPGHSIRITIYDDIAAVDDFRAMAQGVTWSGLTYAE